MDVETSSLTDLELLMLTIIGESRGEPIEGQVAVGCVIRNRVFTWRKNYGEICLAAKQFSCWNEDDPNRSLLIELGSKLINNEPIDPLYKQCQYVAEGIYYNKIMDNVHGSLYYLNRNLFISDHRPEWARNASFPIGKGNQVFFNVNDNKSTIKA